MRSRKMTQMRMMNNECTIATPDVPEALVNTDDHFWEGQQGVANVHHGDRAARECFLSEPLS